MKTDRKEIFKSRFNEHYPRLCSIAYEYVSDADDSEDIVQELFINGIRARMPSRTRNLQPISLQL